MKVYNWHLLPLIPFCYSIGEVLQKKKHIKQLAIIQTRTLKSIFQVDCHTASIEVYTHTKALFFRLICLEFALI